MSRFKKKKVTVLIAFVACLVMLVSLSFLVDRASAAENKSEKKESSMTKNQQLPECTEAEEKYRSLDEWQGSWESFVDYCDTESLSDAWETIADETDIDEDKLRDTFKALCFVADDVKYFDIDGQTITGYDRDNDKVFSHEYMLVKVYEKDSSNTVIEGEVSYLLQANEEAGRFNYISIMPICYMEDSTNGMEMVEHFHFDYGSTPETATDRSGIPTMLRDNSTSDKKKETLLAFFLGSAEE